MAGLNTAQIRDRARELGVDISDQQADAILSQAYDPGQFGADAGIVDQLLRGGRGDGAAASPDDMIQDTINELSEQFRQLGERYLKFEEDNPFQFDEVLARQSAEERLSPFYKAELDDFVGGVERARTGIETERQLLVDLNRIATGAAKRGLEESIRLSEEGFAGTGLFESGQRQRETGLRKIAGAEQAEERRRRFEAGIGDISRRGEGITAQESTFRRRQRAEQETSLQRDIEEQRRQERAQYEVGRLESLGPEFMGRQLQGGGLQSFIQQSFS